MSKSNMYTTYIMVKKRGINVAVMICLVLVWKNTLSEDSSSGE